MTLKYTKESDSFVYGKKKHAKYNGSFIDQYNVLHSSGQPCRPCLTPGTFYKIVSSGQCYNPHNTFNNYFDMILIVDNSGEVYGVAAECFDLTDTYKSDSEIWDLENEDQSVLHQTHEARSSTKDNEEVEEDDYEDYEEEEEYYEEPVVIKKTIPTIAPKVNSPVKVEQKTELVKKEEVSIDKIALDLMNNDSKNFFDHYFYTFNQITEIELKSLIDSLIITEQIYLKMYKSLYQITKVSKKANLFNVGLNRDDTANLELFYMSIDGWNEGGAISGQIRVAFPREEKFLTLIRNPIARNY